MNGQINGDRLRKLREKAGWSQPQLAKKIGVAGGSSIAEYESSNKTPRPDKLVKLARLFNTSVDYLLGVTDEKLPVDEWKAKAAGKTIDLDDAFENQLPTFEGKPVTDEEAVILLEFLRAYRKRKEKELNPKKDEH